MLQTLKEKQLFAKFLKYEFWWNAITFSYFISGVGIMVDLQKVTLVTKCPRPMIPIDIWSFLGLTIYYMRFVESFSSIDALLTKLTKKKLKFLWSDACAGSFKKLKDKLTSTPVLTLPEALMDLWSIVMHPKWGLGVF